MGRIRPVVVGDPLSAHLDWLRLRGLRPATITQRAYAVRRLARRLDGVLLLATEEDLWEWRLSLAHLAAVTVCTEVMHVHKFYSWAVDEGLLGSDPSRRLVRPKKPPRLPRPMSDTDLDLALSHARQPIHAWLTLAAYAGLRAGELARLQRSDVLDTADPPVIFIADGKGGRQRIIPMGSTVLTELRTFGLPSRGFVFGRADGRAGGNSPARVSQAVNRFLHDLGIDATLHCARHTFGTRLYRVSRDIRMTGAVMGHADPATTAGYVQWSDEHAVAAVRALDKPRLTAV